MYGIPRLIKCFTVRFTEHVYEITLRGSALFGLNDSGARESCLNRRCSEGSSGGRASSQIKKQIRQMQGKAI